MKHKDQQENVTHVVGIPEWKRMNLEEETKVEEP